MLGPDLKKAAQLARNFKLFPTEYSNLEREKLPPAELCITKMIKRSSKEHFIIATNDPKLRHKCRLEKVPYLYIHGNQLIIEGVQKYANFVNSEKNKVEIDGEVEKLRAMKREKGLEGKKHSNNNNKKFVNKNKKKMNKDKKKIPNPLSCKKKAGAGKSRSKRQKLKKESS